MSLAAYASETKESNGLWIMNNLWEYPIQLLQSCNIQKWCHYCTKNSKSTQNSSCKMTKISHRLNVLTINIQDKSQKLSLEDSW